MNKDSARTTAQRILESNTNNVELGFASDVFVKMDDLQTIARAFLEGQEWVPVGERLPDELTGVLITAIQNDRGTMLEPFVGEGYIVEGRWYWDQDEYRDMPLVVSAWREKPAPYRPEPEDENQDSV